jgi:hypothetical protein
VNPAAWVTSSFGGVSELLSSPEAKELGLFTLRTLISWGGAWKIFLE